MRRQLSPLDRLIAECDLALQVLAAEPVAQRPNPAHAQTPRVDHSPVATTESGQFTDSQPALSAQERAHAAGLMRVNHVGEICAQALYRGQALFAKDDRVRTLMQESAREEVDHLAWTQQRLTELKDRTSLLGPAWYAGAFALGALAARMSDPVSLGFMAETERQVEAHLQGHLKELPAADRRSRAIVAQMQADEAEHRRTAERAGAAPVPAPVKWLMQGMAKVMTSTAYRV